MHWICGKWNMRRVISDFRRTSCPHTGDVSFKICKGILLKWNLAPHINFIITNNASNIVLGVIKLHEHLRTEFEQVYETDFRFHNWCITHVRHLAVKEGMGARNDHINSITSVANVVLSSAKRRDIFIHVCEQTNTLAAIPCLDVVTAWDSTFRMVLQVCAPTDVLWSTVLKILELMKIAMIGNEW